MVAHPADAQQIQKSFGRIVTERRMGLCSAVRSGAVCLPRRDGGRYAAFIRLLR